MNSIFEKNKENLKKFILDKGEKPYRADQIWRSMYVDLYDNFNDISTIPDKLKKSLNNELEFSPLKLVVKKKSKDKSTDKYLWRLHDNKLIETVLMRYDEDGHRRKRRTVCISSQVGCALDCKFCATGQQGFSRQLTVGEIVSQVVEVKKELLKEDPKIIKDQNNLNIVFMGMGEPLYNYQEVTKAIKILLDNEGLCYSRRKITLSTSGVVPIIQKLKYELDVSLAISLHAVTDDVRNELVPINKKWPIKELLSSLEVYPGVNNSRRITFEYIMLDGVNDSINDAKKLVKLLKPIHAKVNLIPFNPWPGSIYRCSSDKTIKDFADEVCYNGGITATVRHARGQDILAACGQLKSNSVRLSKEKVVKINAA